MSKNRSNRLVLRFSNLDFFLLKSIFCFGKKFVNLGFRSITRELQKKLNKCTRTFVYGTICVYKITIKSNIRSKSELKVIFKISMVLLLQNGPRVFVHDIN